MARSTRTKTRRRSETARRRPEAPSSPSRPSPNGSAPAKKRVGAPRSLIATTVACLVIALALLAWDLTDGWRVAPPPVSGQIIRPMGGGIALVDPSSGSSREIVRGEASAAVTAVAWSPDRSKIAYTLFHKRPEDRISSAELYVVPAGGGDPTLVVPRDQPGAIVDAPVWAPDGQSIFYAYQGVANGKPVARVGKVALADGAQRPLYEDASFPTVSPDGRALAFVYDDGQGFSLRVGSVDGGDAKEIVASSAFVAVAGPRFSPDGSRIAFAGLSPRDASGNPIPPASASPAPVGQRLIDILTGTSVAEAHGDPWGIWTVRPDGSELRPATTLLEDEPQVAWSPDGTSLAVHGGNGLWIVDLSGATQPRRIGDGAIGPIGW